MNLIFLGPPGSGKGTQAIRVAQKYNLVHLSTGDLLRQEIKDETVLGAKVEECIARGDLVPDEMMITLIENRIASGDLDEGFILDGFPRTIPQAENLKEMFARNSIGADRALLLKVSDDELVRRIQGRAEIEGRADDTEEVVRNRLAVYNTQTKPIEEFYRKESILREIEGEANPDEVFDRIVDAVK